MLTAVNRPSTTITTASLGIGASPASRPSTAIFQGWGPRF
jgi:hypothetical protein